MHGARRRVTVTCHTDIELLTVAREDFVINFTHEREPEFITFLRSIDVLRGWPIDCLPYNKPHICTAVYFRSARWLSCRLHTTQGRAEPVLHRS